MSKHSLPVLPLDNSIVSYLEAMQVWQKKYGAKRPCGGCTACCDVVAVAALGKPYYCRCEHQGENGCRIYGQHPAECRAYACFWVMGLTGDETRRPDRFGFVIAPDSDGDGIVYISVHCTLPQFTPEQYEQVLFVIQKLRNKMPEWAETRWYAANAKIGVAFDCQPPYPTETSYSGNNSYMLEGMYFHRESVWPEWLMQRILRYGVRKA